MKNKSGRKLIKKFATLILKTQSYLTGNNHKGIRQKITKSV